MDDVMYERYVQELDRCVKACKSRLGNLRYCLDRLALYDQVKICDSMYDDLLDLIDQVNDAL